MPIAPYAPPQSYNTRLGPLDEMAFRQWVKDNRVPFDVGAAQSDYDMRGYWRAMQQGNPAARSGVNPNDAQLHYPDLFKTLLHETLSNESMFAPPGAPSWINESQLALPSGRIVFDELQPGRYRKR
jgi:hypothetical protein